MVTEIGEFIHKNRMTVQAFANIVGESHQRVSYWVKQGATVTTKGKTVLEVNLQPRNVYRRKGR